MKSIRKGEKVEKQRIYLGANLDKKELEKLEKQADMKITQEQYPKKEHKNKEIKQIKKQENNNSELPEQLNAKKRVCCKLPPCRGNLQRAWGNLKHCKITPEIHNSSRQSNI